MTFEEAATRYCRWVLEGQHGPLIRFFEKLKSHLESMPADEVQFYLKVRTRARDCLLAQTADDPCPPGASASSGRPNVGSRPAGTARRCARSWTSSSARAAT